jgi:hypothetical protein
MRYPRKYELDGDGRASLRYFAEWHAKNAEEHAGQAGIDAENARRCLEAAEARAAEKLARKEQRRAARAAPPSP